MQLELYVERLIEEGTCFLAGGKEADRAQD